MERRLVERLERGDPCWPPQLAVAVAIAAHFGLSDKLIIGPAWVLPSIEAGLLVILVLVVRGEDAPPKGMRHPRRMIALGVTGFVSLANIGSLVLLIDRLINGGGNIAGHRLIASGMLLWLTNVLLFAVWYWEMDRRDPDRPRPADIPPDFWFARMEHDDKPWGRNWRPMFGDYLYLSLTNAVAFSPTDTMPLTRAAKIVMGVQSIAALATIGLVIARAVNVLG